MQVANVFEEINTYKIPVIFCNILGELDYIIYNRLKTLLAPDIAKLLICLKGIRGNKMKVIKNILFIITGLFLAFGLTNQAAATNRVVKRYEPVQQSPKGEAGTAPIITFEYTEYNFGDVDPDISVHCNFKFKNTGTSVLKIESVTSSCGCVVTELKKKEYQPGESGEISINFSTGKATGPVIKFVYVVSNDKKEPRLNCTIKANVVSKVQISPEQIVLSLKKPNAGCPDINVFSTDGREFAITGFRSVPDCMSLAFDPCSRATRFTIKPTVNLNMLTKNLRGTIFINTSHPLCNSVTAIFEAPALYKAQPVTIYFSQAEPGKPMLRTEKVWVTSNYNEDFEIESTSSEKGCLKALNIEKVGPGRYSMNLQATPPKKPAATEPQSFSDRLIIKLTNGDRIEISCFGFYALKPATKK